MKQSQSQQGIGAVVVIVLLAVLGVTGYLGWQVWQKNNQETKPAAQATTKTTEPEVIAYKRTTTVPADWNTYTNEKYGLSLAYPPTWRIDARVSRPGDSGVFGEATELLNISYISPDVATFVSTMQAYDQPITKSLQLLRSGAATAASKPALQQITYDGLLGVRQTMAVPVEEQKNGVSDTSYSIGNDTYTFSLPGAYKYDQESSGKVYLSAHDSLVMFESIKIK
jgi:hypothetical protein